MSTTSINGLTYIYPISKDFGVENNTISINELKNLFESFFKGENSRFLELRDLLIENLNSIFSKKDNSKVTLKDTYDHIKFSSFVSQFAEDCVEGVNAYKFYGNQIVSQINNLTDYIKKANELLAKWDTLKCYDNQTISDLIHADVVELECLVKFCLDVEIKFCTRYVYDFDEDNWKTVGDIYVKTEPPISHFQVGDKGDNYSNLSDLRSMQVKCDRRGNGEAKKLECYNELNLLDRLKYIKVYYDITGGKTDYIFPNDKVFGLPCVKDEDKTKYISNIEKFYLGYLIDRDGPVNAFAGFFEMKVKALEATISIQQQELKALNAYLRFINRALDLLNAGQSSGDQRICDGTIIAMTYLCGQKMYKLFTDNSGKEFLVIPSVLEANKFFLVSNDEAGMNFLIGNNGNNRGNSSTCLLKTLSSGLILAGYYITTDNSTTIKISENPSKYYTSGTLNDTFYKTQTPAISGTFTLPDEIDVNIIDPKSAYKYSTAYEKWNNPTAENGNLGWKAVIESWNSTFQTKITYINTALQSVQTDIKTLRDTINTFESLTKTLRSRTHDAAINIINKLTL